jgi:hypothetical protein
MKEECNPNIAKFRMGCYSPWMAGLTKGERTLMKEVVNDADIWTPRLEAHVGRLEPPLVLFAEDNVPRIDRPVDGKYSIEVIDLMLQQLGQTRFRPQHMASPLLILIPHSDRQAAADLYQKVREAEAIVPQCHQLAAALHHAWIDENLRPVNVQDNDPGR